MNFCTDCIRAASVLDFDKAVNQMPPVRSYGQLVQKARQLLGALGQATALVLALTVGSNAFALNPDRSLTQYAHTSWSSVDGAFQGHPRAIAQTRDGYLWIGTTGGIVRFDGAQFEPLRTLANTTLADTRTSSLLATSDGSLWISSAGSVKRWNGKELTTIALAGRSQQMIEQGADEVWTTRTGMSDGKGPLCKLSAAAATATCFGVQDRIPFPYAIALARADDGALWLASARTVERWTPDSSKLYGSSATGLSDSLEGVDALAFTSNKELLVGFVSGGKGLGLQRLLADGTWRAFVADGLAGETLKVSRLLIDRTGTIWIGTFNQGLIRVRDGKAQGLRSADGLSSDSVTALFEDREGSLWVGTTKGLDRFRDLHVATFGSRQGLTEDGVQSITSDLQGELWVSNTHGLDRLQGGEFRSVKARSSTDVREYTAISVDSSGRPWVGVDGGLAVIDKGRLIPITANDGGPIGVVFDMAQAPDGTTWALATGKPRKLLQILDGKIVRDLPAPSVIRIACDTEGTLWMANASGGIDRYRHGELEAIYASATPSGPFNELRAEPAGPLMAAGPQGFLEWRDGTARWLTTDNGLPCDSLFSSQLDGQNNLWLYASCGIIRISSEDLSKWRSAPKHRISPMLLDSMDGAQGARSNYGKTSTRSADGKIWFTNGVQLQMVDPEQVRANPFPPSVHIQKITADHKTFPPTARLDLPVSIRDLRIDYTATSFVIPQKVRFRYRLEGHDANWEEAGSRRSAFYTDLPPGKYRFRVIASNNDGVWNGSGDALEFEVPPTFVQTRTFKILAVAMFMAAIWAATRWRVRTVSNKMRLRLEGRLEERVRIARELHDTLLQSARGLVLTVQATLPRLQADERAQTNLRAAMLQANDAISEGRDRIMDLRAPMDSALDLESRLRSLTHRFSTEVPAELELTVHGAPWELDEATTHNLESLASEAIQNASRHAQASRITVTLSFAAQQLMLAVQDDGVGIAPEILQAGGVAGHWGLQGMRERASSAGGHVAIESSPGEFTKVVVTVPASPSLHRHWLVPQLRRRCQRAWDRLRQLGTRPRGSGKATGFGD